MPRSFKNTKKSKNNKKKLISKILKEKKKYGGAGSGLVAADPSPGSDPSPGPVSSSILGYNIYEGNGKDSYILVPVYEETKFEKETYTIHDQVLIPTNSLKEYEEVLIGTPEPINYKIGDEFDFQVSKYEDGIFEVKVIQISGDLNARDIMDKIKTGLTDLRTNCNLAIAKQNDEHRKVIVTMREELNEEKQRLRAESKKRRRR